MSARSPASCVLGAPLARQLFGYRDPLGETIRIWRRITTSVVGVLREQGGDPPAAPRRWPGTT